MHRLGDLRIASEQAQIGIEARGGGIVISGAEMGVAADFAVRIASHQQGKLAMRLQADQAVIDLHASFLQAARPADVGSFVEAGFEFHDDGDLFFGGSFHQRADDGRIFAGTVESLLDREHVGIVQPRFR